MPMIPLWQTVFKRFEQPFRVLNARRHRSDVSLEKLRLAFFGSDKFSIHSLASLVKLQFQIPQKISSIHVITRSPKSRGRKTKSLPDLPIATFLKNQQLPFELLRADSAEEISQLNKSHHFDLSIAVAYGILIPGEFLESCTYGGLNVHPSLLPKYSGSSPLQYALMNGDSYTGCTVQTLHPTKFDHGRIILQSKEIPINELDNYETLEESLGKLGGDLLADVIANDLFLESKIVEPTTTYAYSLAAKVKPEKAQIKWHKLTSKEIVSLEKALGTLYSHKEVNVIKKKSVINELQKVNFRDITIVHNKNLSQNIKEKLKNPGDFALQTLPTPKIIAKTVDGFIAISRATFQCYQEEQAEAFFKALHKRSGATLNQFLTKL